jgi:hypothetical protein
MKDSDIQAVALKHGLPMTHAYDHPWAYTDQVMAFGRELAGDTPPRRVFPPLPLSVFEHPKLGEMWMRFDLHSYAERHARNVQDELDALKNAARTVLANGTQHDVGGGDVFLSTCDSTEALQRACDCAEGKIFSDVEPDGSTCPACTAIHEIGGRMVSRIEAPKGFRVRTVSEGLGVTLVIVEPSVPAIECAARKQGTAGGNAPADCDWPGCDCDPEAGKVIEALLEQHNVATTFAQRDVLRERSEQGTREGFGPAHDDAHRPGVLSKAAAAYALAASDELTGGAGGFFRMPSRMWPFSMTWWKPKNPRTAMVKAAALLIAEIEKIDRADAQRTK